MNLRGKTKELIYREPELYQKARTEIVGEINHISICAFYMKFNHTILGAMAFNEGTIDEQVTLLEMYEHVTLLDKECSNYNFREWQAKPEAIEIHKVLLDAKALVGI